MSTYAYALVKTNLYGYSPNLLSHQGFTRSKFFRVDLSWVSSQKENLNRVHPVTLAVKRFNLVNEFDSLAFWPCIEPSAVLVWHEDEWVMREKKMSRRDRFLRVVKKAQLYLKNELFV